MQQDDLWPLLERNMERLRSKAYFISQDTLAGRRAGTVLTRDDLLQEGIYRALRYAASFDPGPDNLPETQNRNIVYYLGRIMNNLVITFVTKRNISCEFSAPEEHLIMLERAANKHAAASGPQDVAAARKEDAECLYLGLEALGKSNPDEALVLLYSLDADGPCSRGGENGHAVASALGLSSTNYRQKKFQGIKKLRTYLTPYLN